MGYAKRVQMENQDKFSIAMYVAVLAGVLTRCDLTGDIYDGGGTDILDAYKLGSKMMRANDMILDDLFESQRELTDYIKQAYDQAPYGCPTCERGLSGD